jgi:hypothetical protein
VDAATLARALGVDRSFVYRHAAELGAVRIGGPQGRLRFDPQAARSASACSAGGRSQGRDASAEAKSAPKPRPGRRRSPNGAPKPGAVLAVRPRKAAR